MVEPREDDVKKVEDEDDDEWLQFKVIILGDGAVGKTSTIMRFSQDYFATQYKQTLGIDFFSREILLPGNLHCSLQLWDIGGQSIGSKMLSSYVLGSQAVLLVYDITNFQSFENLQDWLDIVKRTYAERKEPMPYLAILGNKTDLEHLRAVPLQKHNQFAKDENLHSYFASAKQGDQVRATFTRIAADLANVGLTKTDLDAAIQVIPAQIVNHQQNDPDTQPVNLKGKDKGSKCVVM